MRCEDGNDNDGGGETGPSAAMGAPPAASARLSEPLVGRIPPKARTKLISGDPVGGMVEAATLLADAADPSPAARRGRVTSAETDDPIRCAPRGAASGRFVAVTEYNPFGPRGWLCGERGAAVAPSIPDEARRRAAAAGFIFAILMSDGRILGLRASGSSGAGGDWAYVDA